MSGMRVASSGRPRWTGILSRLLERVACASRVSMTIALLVGAPLANAGPPLFSDDPHTVGRGVFQGIVALEGISLGQSSVLGAPNVDLTLGLLDGLDLTLLGVPLFEVEGPGTVPDFLEVGFKWQFVKGPRWNLSFSPALGVTFASQADFAVVLPIQAELSHGLFAFGVDGGYLVVPNGGDLWRANVYGTWQAAEPLWLMAEVWSVGSVPGLGADIGTSVGIDWALPHGLDALAAVGTGLASPGALQRITWTFYAGLQWTWQAF